MSFQHNTPVRIRPGSLAVLLCLFTACAGDGPYPASTDAGITDIRYVGSSGPTTPPEPSPGSPIRRDSGHPRDWYRDAGESTCMCGWAVYTDPPYTCFYYFCLGDACIEIGFIGEGRCFYTGHDPAS